MSQPNAKICPRCGKVVPIEFGVCDHCARLFRTSFDRPLAENKTIMFEHGQFPPAKLTRSYSLKLRLIFLLRQWRMLCSQCHKFLWKRPASSNKEAGG